MEYIWIEADDSQENSVFGLHSPGAGRVECRFVTRRTCLPNPPFNSSKYRMLVHPWDIKNWTWSVTDRNCYKLIRMDTNVSNSTVSEKGTSYLSWGLEKAKDCLSGKKSKDATARLRIELHSTNHQLHKALYHVQRLLEERRKHEMQEKRLAKVMEEKKAAEREARRIKEERDKNTVLFENLERNIHSKNVYLQDSVMIAESKLWDAEAEKASLKKQVEDLQLSLVEVTKDKELLRKKLRAQELQSGYQQADAERLAREVEGLKTEVSSKDKQVEDLQLSLTEVTTLKVQLAEELRLQKSESIRQKAKSKNRKLEVKNLKVQVERLQKEKRFLSDKYEDSEYRRKCFLRDLKEAQVEEARLTRLLKAKDMLLDSLWSEVYEPTERCLLVRQVKKLEAENQSLSTALEAMEDTFSNMGLKLATLTPFPSDVRHVKKLEAKNQSLSDAIQARDDVIGSMGLKLAALTPLPSDVRRVRRLETENQSLSDALKAKEVVVGDMSLKLAAMTALPSDGPRDFQSTEPAKPERAVTEERMDTRGLVSDDTNHVPRQTETAQPLSTSSAMGNRVAIPTPRYNPPSTSSRTIRTHMSDDRRGPRNAHSTGSRRKDSWTVHDPSRSHQTGPSATPNWGQSSYGNQGAYYRN